MSRSSLHDVVEQLAESVAALQRASASAFATQLDWKLRREIVHLGVEVMRLQRLIAQQSERAVA